MPKYFWRGKRKQEPWSSAHTAKQPSELSRQKISWFSLKTLRSRMKVLYSSDLHGEIHLYQQLLDLTLASSSEIIAIGGDFLPSYPPSKRYEDMIPNQKAFIHQFLL